MTDAPSLIFLRRCRRFHRLMSRHPDREMSAMIKYLCRGNVFNKRMAIMWINNRQNHFSEAKMWLERSPLLNRRFLNHLREMSLLLGCFIPKYALIKDIISEEHYNLLRSMQLHFHLVTVVAVNDNHVIVRFPEIYDRIMHKFCLDHDVDTKTPHRILVALQICYLITRFNYSFPKWLPRTKLLFPSRTFATSSTSSVHCRM